VQVNGKLRDQVVVPVDIAEESLKQLALSSDRGQNRAARHCGAAEAGEYRGEVAG